MIINNRSIEIPRFSEALRNIPSIVLMYLYIFQPPFISRTGYFFIEFLIFLIFIVFKPSVFIKIFKKFKKEYLLFLIILFYSLLRDLLKGEQVFFFKMFLWFFQTFIFSILIVSFFEVKKITKKIPEIFSLFYWSVISAGFMSFCLLIIPSFYSFYNSLIIKDPSITYNLLVYRGYGVSENLTFTYSYLLGIFTGYTFLLLNKRSIYIVFLPFLLVGTLFNARIGFLPIFIFSVILLLQKKKIKSILVALIFLLLIVSILPNLEIFKYFEHNKNWISGFFIDILNFFSGEKSYGSGSSLKVLTDDFIIIPETPIDLIFGRGINLFLSFKGRFSDIGYINQLNYGGITFLTLLFLLFIVQFKRLKSFFGLKNWFVIVFSISILVLNFKGSAFASTPGARFLYTMYISMIITGYKMKGYKI